MLVMLQDAFEKEMDTCYTENEVKKLARELNVLYEQNKEFQKVNKN